MAEPPEPVASLMPAVYTELRRIAARYISRERPGQTLQPTALVNEAFLRLAAERPREFQNRTHFVAIAALSMRQLLVQRARARQALKRGGAPARVTLDDNAVADGIADGPTFGAARDVELRYFGGLTIEETAEAMGFSPATVKRQWAVARAWLKRALQPSS